MVIGPKNHRRWEISLKEGEDPKQMATPEGTWSVLERWLRPDDAQLWRQASYRFHALVAERWRVGRVFVAGDAAHQQPPFLGQGMCQGIRDVTNLAWKLVAVLEDRAHEALLDSYGAERKQHVIQLTTRIKHIGELVGERDLDRARARDARLLAECGGVVQPMPRQEVQPALKTGLVSSKPHAAHGTLFPQPWVWQGDRRVRLDAVAGTGWRLVLDGTTCLPAQMQGSRLATLLPLQAVRISCEPLAEMLCETDGVLATWFRKHRCNAVLVRPDHYVYGVAETPDGIASLWAELEASMT
jgi:3-(3-hydroxy-phenyl)propionate hydroxylase